MVSTHWRTVNIIGWLPDILAWIPMLLDCLMLKKRAGSFVVLLLALQFCKVDDKLTSLSVR
jgi:hypothetical protein